MGRRALEKAVKYANERVVFGRQIGKYFLNCALADFLRRSLRLPDFITLE